MYSSGIDSRKESCTESDNNAESELGAHAACHIERHAEQNKTQQISAEDIAKNVVQNYVSQFEELIHLEVKTCKSVKDLKIWYNQKVENMKDSLYEVGLNWDSQFTLTYANELEKKAQAVLDQSISKFLMHTEHNILMKVILVEGSEYYHEEMRKYFRYNKFIEPNDLVNYHNQSKTRAIAKCENRRKLTTLQQDDLRTALDDLFPKYMNLNFMNAEAKGGSDFAPAIGVDLGTTYCCVGVYYKGKVHIIPNVNDGYEKTTPSYVAFNPDGSETIGDKAKYNAYKYPENTIYDVKRIIGRKMNDIALQDDMKYWPFTVTEHNGVPKILVNGRYYHPEEVSSKLLKYLRNMAEKFLHLPEGTIKKAVITVPAYFNDGQRHATFDAGQLAGLDVLTILNEPTAAAIPYSMELWDSNAKHILVYDLGGGTFDVAILEMKTNEISVLAVRGDTHLGGEDFDRNVMQFCVARFQEETYINLLEGKDSAVKTLKDGCYRRLLRLQRNCENAKKDLTAARRVKITVDSIIDDKDLSVVVTRGTFEEINMPLFEKTIQLVEKTLKDVKLTKQDIDDIVLVGGSSRIPTVQRMLEEYFEGKTLNRSIDPDHAVGYGAAVKAALMNGAMAVEDFKLRMIADVTPMPIGVEIATGQLSVILERNSKIPISTKKTYYTVEHNQTAIYLKIYQGDNLQMANQNELLGSFKLTGIPPAPAGRQPIDVTMKIDSMGVLHVEAVCRSTQNKKIITVVEDKQRMTQEEKQGILAEGTKFANQDASTTSSKATFTDARKIEKGLVQRDTKMHQEAGKFYLPPDGKTGSMDGDRRVSLVDKECISGELEREQDAIGTESDFLVSQDEIRYDIHSEPIGRGGMAAVFKGYFGSQVAAIKKIADVYGKEEKDRIEREVRILITCDHRNIVKYLQMRKETKGSSTTFLLAMEYCEITLREWIQQNDLSTEKLGRTKRPINPIEIMHGITSGLHHLHSLETRIIHRDLKPENVLFKNLHGEIVVKVGDFGLSGIIMEGMSHLTVHTRAGTRQWMPPEILEYLDNDDTSTKTIQADIYPLGCLFYYVLTKGKHPFRIAPSALSKYNPLLKLEDLQDGSLHYNCLHLIKRMISYKAEDRPSTEDIMNHHIFWDDGKKLLFLNETSDFFVKKETYKMTTFLKEFAEHLLPMFNYTIFRKIFDSCDGWCGCLSETVQLGLVNEKAKSPRKYDGKSIIDLLKAIRNLKAHYGEKNPSVRKEVGKAADEYFRYWHAEERFPFLLDLVWTSFLNYSKTISVKDDELLESMIKTYYTGIKFDFTKMSA